MGDEQNNTLLRKHKNTQNLNEKSNVLKSAFALHNRHISSGSIKEVINSKPDVKSFETFKDIIDEGVHDAHGLGGDSGVGVDLLQHLVDVDGVGLLPLALLLLLVSLGNGLGSLARLGGSLSGGLGWHGDGLGCSGVLMAVPLTGFPLSTSSCSAGDAIGTA